MILKRVIAIFLTALLLLADNGQMLFAHTCLKSHHTSINLSKVDCCAGSHVTTGCTVHKTSCCETSSKYMKQPVGRNANLKQWNAGNTLYTTCIFFKSSPTSPFLSEISASFPPILLLGKSDIHFTGVVRC